ncbi:MAG: tetratricopeptide repeat protein [Chloroflexi bacterium]|nr:tetratricopeptide repeat protein [Chloroflexota bacterium]
MIAVADLGLELGWETERLAFLCNWIGFYLQFLADYVGARPYYERALTIREKALGPDHPDTARSLNNLGTLAYYEGNKHEAARLMQQALTILQKKLGDNHPDTQNSRQSLATIQSDLQS